MKLILILLIYSLSTPLLLAKKLYQYQDKQGQWHYSDKPPQTKRKVEIKQLTVAQKKYVHLQKLKAKSKTQYSIINDFHAPVEIKFYIKNAKNVQSNPLLPHHFVIDHGQSKNLLTVSSITKFKSWRYQLRYNYTVGDPQAKHDKNAIYLPPFAPDSRFRITQAFNGKFSHSSDRSKYAVDIRMPLKTPIHAARSGVVVQVKNDFFKNGLTKSHISRANKIRILHDDGTMAIYGHLSLETVQVYEGLKVSAGQLIGYSGNTGYSTGPHLHFSIQINTGMKSVSVPFKFSGKEGVKTPIKGEWLER